MLSLIREFRRDRRSAAAMEFYFVATFLIIVVVGVFDISEAMICEQEVYDSAHTIAASASNIAVNQTTGATNMSWSQIQLAESLIWADVPSLRGNFQDGTKSVTLSSIVFEPTFTGATCTNGSLTAPCYVPVVAWSAVYAGGDAPATTPPGTFTYSSSDAAHAFYYTPQTYGDAVYTSSGSEPHTCGSTGTSDCVNGVVGTNGNNASGVYPNPPLRPCDGNATIPASSSIIGSLNQTVHGSGSPSDLTNLPSLDLSDGQNLNANQTGSFAPPAPILVVDIHFQYTPLLGLILNKSSIDYYVNAYWPVRSVEATTITTSGTTESITSLTLYKQFTTITGASVYTATNTPVSYQDYCWNTSLSGSGT